MSEWIEREGKVFMQFFNRYSIVVERGEGCWLYDEDGKKYLDLIAGIACVSVGHGNEFVASRIAEQARKLMHVSNLFYTKPQVELAEKLKEITSLDRFFFTNSGTESVEAALKIARRATGRKKFVAFTNGFHGRTMGALSVTWKEKFRKPFEPLVGPVSFADFNSIESLERAADRDTAAVILEPVQGEAGVFPADRDFVRRIFELRDELGFLVIFDEVQTGFGRTGEWFAKDIYNATPDIMTMAKAMGNGFPVGAVAVSEDVHTKIEKGDHGSTFGGNPLACEAALATIEYIEQNNLLENARRMGELFMNGLKGLDFVEDVRGFGLMIGVSVGDAKGLSQHLMSRSVLVNATSERDVRIIPPLTIREEEVSFALSAFREYGV
ncbi:transaminase, acetylornithine/succinylornithine family [Geoglobus ahangari]|uniref:Transaminase, acetylornithine/succinylornithine family n=1 Tax=Geoglobus ahangari TaxID=113653 RepID=A0A0F7ID97_9EURY|nr:aspartate aminotransferase family protein [Geoglobus ahangari]AKG90903.1 transaminase, acetylornithine/succinylornithine family [Geoglobus ahangari]